MEGVQYLQHRVVDGTYQAVMRWRINEGVVSYMDKKGHWIETDIPVRFLEDRLFEAAIEKGES